MAVIEGNRITITNKQVIKRLAKELSPWYKDKTLDFDENSNMAKIIDKLYGLDEIKKLEGVKQEHYRLHVNMQW